MSKNLLSMAFTGLMLCIISTTSTASDIKVLGLSANELVTNHNIRISFPPDPTQITALRISSNGIKACPAYSPHYPDPCGYVREVFSQTPFGQKPYSNNRSEKFYPAGHNMVPFTVLGTNAENKIRLIKPHPFIKSIILHPPIIKYTFDDQQLRIGSIWGDFTQGADEQELVIYFVGYSKITLELNLDAIRKLLEFLNENSFSRSTENSSNSSTS